MDLIKAVHSLIHTRGFFASQFQLRDIQRNLSKAVTTDIVISLSNVAFSQCCHGFLRSTITAGYMKNTLLSSDSGSNFHQKKIKSVLFFYNINLIVC